MQPFFVKETKKNIRFISERDMEMSTGKHLKMERRQLSSKREAKVGSEQVDISDT